MGRVGKPSPRSVSLSGVSSDVEFGYNFFFAFCSRTATGLLSLTKGQRTVYLCAEGRLWCTEGQTVAIFYHKPLPRAWKEAEIRRVDRRQVQVQYTVQNKTYQYWFHLDGDDIVPLPNMAPPSHPMSLSSPSSAALRPPSASSTSDRPLANSDDIASTAAGGHTPRRRGEAETEPRVSYDDYDDMSFVE